MNPEEGELRPQLLDRFGLTVEVAAPRDPAQPGRGGAPPAGVRRRPGRVRGAVRRRGGGAGRRDRRGPGRGCRRSCSATTALEQIAAVCAAFEVDGLRADIVIARAAVAHAAWRGAGRGHRRGHPGRGPAGAAAPAAAQPVRRARAWTRSSSTTRSASPTTTPGAAPSRRTPRGPGGRPTAGPVTTRRPARDDGGRGRRRAGGRRRAARTGRRRQTARALQTQAAAGTARPQAGGPGRESVAPSGATFRARRLEVPGMGEGAAGRRSRAATDAGRSVGARPPQPAATAADVHLAATLTAARRTSGGAAGPGPGCCLSRRPARAPPGGPRVEPGAVRGRRLRVDGRPPPDGARSRAPCCPCCSTPTSGATRSA